MSKIKNISGFPEWLPQEKILEDEMIGSILSTFKHYGFVPIETPAVELLSTLTAKGVIDKEIYALRRAKEGDSEEKDKLALHFDLTVPFTRYVAQHFSNLIFPFKRYQIQKVWRGDRPQKGRFREFYQVDIDIIDRDNLSLSADAEILMAFKEVFDNLSLGSYTIYVNNRKLLLGILDSSGVSKLDQKQAVIAIDKLSKVGPEEVKSELQKNCSLTEAAAEEVLKNVSDKFSPKDLKGKSFEGELSNLGKQELSEVFNYIPDIYYDVFKIDLSLARGLDYYTGLIFEIHLNDYPEFGSCCGGGRYDDLASQFISKKLPGVGASLGFTRLMDLTLSNNLLETNKLTLAKVLVTVLDESQRQHCNAVASELRSNGIMTEVYLKSPKLGKQIEYADKKGIQYVLFIDSDNEKIEVKDLKSKQQQEVTDLNKWCATI